MLFARNRLVGIIFVINLYRSIRIDSRNNYCGTNCKIIMIRGAVAATRMMCLRGRFYWSLTIGAESVVLSVRVKSPCVIFVQGRFRGN